jgi:predicted  nucleic acid-binding Zn-ribbon protein
MSDPQCPAIDGIKYAVVGALVCITTIVATLGWIDIAALVLNEISLKLPLSIALGILMGMLVFTMERMLIVSIPAKISSGGKVIAILWRGVLAGFTATIMTLPIALSYYHNEIIAKLDDEKLQLMQEKRRTIDGVFGLSSTSAAVERLSTGLATNRQLRDELPVPVREIGTTLTSCLGDERKLRQSLQPRIATTLTLRDALSRQLTVLPKQNDILQMRISALTKQINRWNVALATKAQACAGLSQQFEAAKQSYFGELEVERHTLLSNRDRLQTALDSAQKAALPVLSRSDDVVRQRTMPDLSAQIRALYERAAQDRFVCMLLAVFFAFFYMVDMLPIVAKLLSRSIYERLLGAREDKLIAQINSDVVVAQSQGAIKEVCALAEKAGFQTLAREDGGKAFVEYAETSARFGAAKTETQRLFELIDVVADRFEQARDRVDDLESKLQHCDDTPENIERLRSMLNEAMWQSTIGPSRPRKAANDTNESAMGHTFRGRMNA